MINGLRCPGLTYPFLLGVMLGLVLPVGFGGGTARAFDFFGLFGEDETPPEPKADALSYQITLSAIGQAPEDDADLVQALQDASNSWKLRQDSPPDATSLIRRVEGDLGPMFDALWAYGYYGSELVVTVAGVRVTAGLVPLEAVRAATALRGLGVVPVTVTAILGPLFHLRKLAVTGPDGANLAEIGRNEMELEPGDAARATDIRAAAGRVVDYYRTRSHPMAKTAKIDATVDHAIGVLDVALVIDRGPAAGLGGFAITGTKDVPPDVVRSFIYREIGEPYSPRILKETRKAVAQIPALGGVRITEATELDANGNVPLTLEVTERPRRSVGFDLLYSSIDGPSLGGSWQNHNLFGGAEQLRLDARVFTAPSLNRAAGGTVSSSEPSDLGGRFTAGFLKPALWSSRNDLLIDATADRERVGQKSFDGYTSSDISLDAMIRHRWSERLSAQGGIKAEWVNSTDAQGSLDGSLLSAPLSVAYDTSDDALNPTSGFRVKASLAPIWSSFGAGGPLATSRLAASGYYPLDEDAAYVLAARIGVGTIVGADLAYIPPTERFYAGGGASVRGYGYRTLSPIRDGRLTGGRSLVEGSVEARIQLTETVGIVPFVDFGDVFATSVPGATRGTLGIGSGIGLRYLTPVGPLRLDVAAPLIHRGSQDGVALYISIGQAY